jgi:hypothetical protein
MSVITEALENDQIVIISKFVAFEQGKEFDWDSVREFNIGEIVYYVGFYKIDNTKQEYLRSFVKFRTKEGKIYSAKQLYFICEYEWREIFERIKNNNSFGVLIEL